MMNTAIDDSTLLAYLDGQLEADADYLRVEQALEQDAALRQRLQALVGQGEAIRSAFQAKLQEPVPPHLVATIMSAPWPPLAQPAQRPAPDPSPPSPWRRLLRHWAGAWLGRRGGPMAGGAGGVGAAGGAGGSAGAGAAPWLWQGVALASLAGLALLLLLGRAGPGVQAPTMQPHWAQVQAPLQDERVRVALQALPSGQVLRIGADTLELMGSFERAPGQHCRELQESRAVAGAVTQTLAVLCQTPDSGWAVAFAASETLPEGSFVTASGAQQAALQDFYDRLGAVEFLDAADEQARLAAGWQGPAPRP
jgi:anti-sigma factor RsiW